ncbi:Chromo domain/shadow [Penicillium griseofulvum]|uniref:Chromo domain/shadow n=1 Tax=Penicillium patulum TaxID=5078 RepID=A0A135LUZ5_PENPA|nr:Chromo domain/shadow [Penicillium griseofulvum]KXG52793.1 Chromo domain/shadow [Penicillium griseofulvum]
MVRPKIRNKHPGGIQVGDRHRGAVPDDEGSIYVQEEVDAHDRTTKTPDLRDPVNLGEQDDEEDDSSLRSRLQTPISEHFAGLANQCKLLKEKYQDLQDEIDVLKADRVEYTLTNDTLQERLEGLQQELKALRHERDEAVAHRDIALRERGDLAYRLLNATSGIAPIMEAAAAPNADRFRPWDIEIIMDARIHNQKLQYRVQWPGYNVDREWYPAGNFKHTPKKVLEFHMEYRLKPGPPMRLQNWIEAEHTGRILEDHVDDDKPAFRG